MNITHSGRVSVDNIIIESDVVHFLNILVSFVYCVRQIFAGHIFNQILCYYLFYRRQYRILCPFVIPFRQTVKY